MADRRRRRTRERRRSLARRAFLSFLGLTVAAIAGYAVTMDRVPLHEGNDLPGRPSTRWAVVSTDALNVRSGPGAGSEILDSLGEGAPVQVIGDPEDGFVPVAHRGGRAWLAERYLTYDGSTRAVSVNPLPLEEVAAAAEPPAASDAPVGAPPEADPVDIDTWPVDDQAAGSDAEPVDDQPPVSVADVPVERWIDIDRSVATVTLYEGEMAVATFTGRIGRDPSADGFYATAIGTYHVYSMTKGLAPTPFAEDAWLTDWVGFDPERKNGIHSPVRDAEGVEQAWQNPTTLGCVRLDSAAAVAVFDFAEIGMRVEVHE